MDPITLSLILMGVGGAIKGGTQLFQGIKDKRAGEAMESAAGERPEFEMPESVDQIVKMYQQMSRSGLPGQDLMQQDIQASTARTATTAGQLADSPVAALTALGGAQQRELSALRDLQVRAASYQSQAQQGLAGAYQMKAGYETEQWRQNQLLPWEIQMNRAAQLQTAGRGNIMGAADTVGSTFAQAGGVVGGMAQQGGVQGGGSNAAPQYGMVNYGWNPQQGTGLGYNNNYVPPWQQSGYANGYNPFINQ